MDCSNRNTINAHTFLHSYREHTFVRLEFVFIYQIQFDINYMPDTPLGTDK